MFYAICLVSAIDTIYNTLLWHKCLLLNTSLVVFDEDTQSRELYALQFIATEIYSSYSISRIYLNMFMYI